MTNPSLQNVAGFNELLINQSSTIAAAIAAHVALANPHSYYQLTSQKAVAGGYASLDGSTNIPDSQIPTGIQRKNEKGIASGYLGIDSAGRLSSTTGLHNNAMPPSGVASQFIASGTYTPSLTLVGNLDAVTPYKAQWLRVGNVVNVSGKIDADPTLAATATSAGISFPLATAISTPSDCSGVAASPTIAGQDAAITGSTTASIALMKWLSGDITNQPMHYLFQYEMLST